MLCTTVAAVAVTAAATHNNLAILKLKSVVVGPIQGLSATNMPSSSHYVSVIMAFSWDARVSGAVGEGRFFRNTSDTGKSLLCGKLQAIFTLQKLQPARAIKFGKFPG